MHRILVLASLALLAGCSSISSSCGVDQDKLARLKPGLSREEATRLIGCPGKLVSESGASPGHFATVEWRGPDSLLLSRTYVVFLDDRVYTYSTQKRGGY